MPIFQVRFQYQKMKLIICDSIVIKSCPVFLCKRLNNPNERNRIKACGISKKLPKMTVICFFQLIFNQDKCVVSRVFTKDISPEGSNISLLIQDFQFHTN